MPDPPISPEQFAADMRDIFATSDIEEGHFIADSLMCDLLRELGYGEGVLVFEDQEKWYA